MNFKNEKCAIFRIEKILIKRMEEKSMKKVLRCCIFLLVLLGVGSIAYAATPVSWGESTQTTYDTSIPGSILVGNDPLSQGGMNLSTGEMTYGDDIDIVFSSDGTEIGASGISDLGKVDFNEVDEIPNSGYHKIVDALTNHVYSIKLADGSIVKLQIIRNLGSSVTIKYAFGESLQELPDGASILYDTSYPGTSLDSDYPTNHGGFNFANDVMTNRGSETDIAISDDDIGSRAIIDLGEANMNDVGYDAIPASGFSKFVNLQPNHVYITSTHDGEFVKFYVVGNYASKVEIIYQFMAPELTSIDLTGPSSIGSLPVTLKVKAIFNDDTSEVIPNTDVIWESSEESIGTISDSGVLQLTGKTGKVTITAIYGDFEDSITYAVRSLNLIKINQSIKYSSSPVTLTVTGVFSDSTSSVITSGVTWKTSNIKVATVDSKGVVKFTGNSGTVTITATYYGKTASVTCTVGDILKAVTTTTKLSYSDKPVTINVTAAYMNGKTKAIKSGVTWKSSNTNVAKVNSNGVVTFTGKDGSVTITGTYLGKTVTLTYTVKDVVKTLSTTTKLAYSDKPVTINLKAAYTNGNKKVIKSGVVWKSSNKNVAKVGSSGVVTFTGKSGSVTITATYKGKTTSVSCKVGDVVKSIAPTSKLIYSKKPVAMHIKAAYMSGKKRAIKSGVTWKSSNKNVAKVSSSGVVKFSGKKGEVTITATYQGKTTTMLCTVGNVVKTLSTSTRFAYSKKPITIKVIAKYSNGKKVAIKKGIVWKSSNTKVAKVSSSGVVTFTGENGNVTITGKYQGKTTTLKTTVSLKANAVKFFTNKTWRLYMDYVELDVGTLKFNSNGTYTWYKPYGIVVKGKWSVSRNNTVYLYRFGYNLDLTYEMYPDSDTGNVYLVYNHGETGSDFYLAK
jgi:hypothetical protein